MKRIGIFVWRIAVVLAMCVCRAGKHPLHQVEEDFERARRGYQEMREAYPRASEEAGKMEQKIKEYEQFLAENKTMHSDRIVAQQIQRSMLPVGYPASEGDDCGGR